MARATIWLVLVLVVYWSRLGACFESNHPATEASFHTLEIKEARSHIFQLRHVLQHDLSLDAFDNGDQVDHVKILDISDAAYRNALVDVQPAKLVLSGKTMVSGSSLNQDEHNQNFMDVSQFDEAADILPNTTDKDTVVNLAKMTSDAYIFDPREPGWWNTSLGFNFTRRFGWKDDGLRGHVFTTEDESIVVVAYKGTTIDPRDKLSGRDRVNDITLFSCCCGAQNPYYYSPVCGCSTGHYTCNSTCLTSSLLQNDTYYNAAVLIMQKMRDRYPKATFWTVGHSLGGSLASLVGLTFNIPAVTYEAPPERLPAQRMGLVHAKNSVTHHFGNTADPVFMGACNGFFSTCSLWGFAFESQCFTGKRCQYDTVADKGWHVNIGNHRINYVIENVLKAYDTVPKCDSDDNQECQDCFNWKFS